MLFTGDKITGVEAAALGLVLKAVTAEKLDDEVDALARKGVPDSSSMSTFAAVRNTSSRQRGTRSWS